MKKQNLSKTQKGITLVALVVTIVVLLILAGISINLVLGQNGIVAKSKEAKNKTLEDQERTQTGLNNLYDEMLEAIGEGTTTASKTLVQAFKDGDLNVGDYVNYLNPTTVQVTGEGYTTTGYTSLGSKTGLSAENVGDEGFPSGVTTNVDQTYTLNNDLQWRVLGLSEDGTQLLLTSDHVLFRDYDASTAINASNDKYLYLYGAEGVINAPSELNKICAIYTNNYADEVRSLNINDINRLCGVTVNLQPYNLGDTTTNLSKVYKTSDETKTNIDIPRRLGETQTYPTTNYPTQYASPEDFLTGKSSAFTKTSDYYYYSGSSAIASDSQLFEMLFAKGSYWLASSAVSVSSDYCLFGPGLVDYYRAHSFHTGDRYSNGSYIFSSAGDEFGRYYAVRPVVTLKAGVTVDDIQKVETTTPTE